MTPNKSEEYSVMLDSHIFIWSLEQKNKINTEAQNLILGSQNAYVSIVSLWELAIKHKSGKFPYSTAMLMDGLKQSGFKLLELEASHVISYESVKLTHNDPFDALLLSQSLSEELLFMTADKQITRHTKTSESIIDCSV